jgi:hypothetical protein
METAVGARFDDDDWAQRVTEATTDLTTLDGLSAPTSRPRDHGPLCCKR